MSVESLKESAGKVMNVRLLGSDQSLEWKQTDTALEVNFSGIETGAFGYAVEVTLE